MNTKHKRCFMLIEVVVCSTALAAILVVLMMALEMQASLTRANVLRSKARLALAGELDFLKSLPTKEVAALGGEKFTPRLEATRKLRNVELRQSVDKGQGGMVKVKLTADILESNLPPVTVEGAIYAVE